VLRDADTAMYKAKGAGKARYALFDASLHTEVANRLRLEGDLRHAIEDGQLSVAYQPICSAGSGVLSGFEALVRWEHPSDGMISPASFLPIAEETGLMLQRERLRAHCACRQLRQWQVQDPAFAELSMSVNVSGHDIAHPAFVARVTRAWSRPACSRTPDAGADREHPDVAPGGALPMLTELRHLGVALAIDDFGTGYSSLSHLSTLPIDSLKIDKPRSSTRCAWAPAARRWSSRSSCSAARWARRWWPRASRRVAARPAARDGLPVRPGLPPGAADVGAGGAPDAAGPARGPRRRDLGLRRARPAVGAALCCTETDVGATAAAACCSSPLPSPRRCVSRARRAGSRSRADELAVGGHVGHAGLQQVVEAAGHQVRLQDLGRTCTAALKVSITSCTVRSSRISTNTSSPAPSLTGFSRAS
jgi:EAL domain-containing protein (putative c-di-GMP-specific phosphodiesterase class I)